MHILLLYYLLVVFLTEYLSNIHCRKYLLTFLRTDLWWKHVIKNNFITFSISQRKYNEIKIRITWLFFTVIILFFFRNVCNIAWTKNCIKLLTLNILTVWRGLIFLFTVWTKNCKKKPEIEKIKPLQTTKTKY